MQKMSDSRHSNSHHHSHHHHHHHHHYDGPRSSRAEGLSDDYNTRLSDEAFQTQDLDELNDLMVDEDFSEQINKSLEEQLQIDYDDDTFEPAERERSSSDHKRSHRKKEHLDEWNRKQKKSRILVRVLIGIAAFLLALVLIFMILRVVGEMKLKKSVVETPVEVELPEEVEDDDDENLIIYNGERYWYNENIITVLCMGVDREEFASPDEMVIGGNGQADADVLVIFDKEQGKMSFLNISRDCLVDIDRYNKEGQFIDTVNEQLCLSYAFGNGKQTSCENTALSVSRLLYGMPINAYAAIDFDSIATLNDEVGGVSVPVTEEIADKFPGTQVGALVNLVGSEAVTYVRTRDIELLDSNNARMSRQKQYVIAFLKKALQQIKEDPTKALSLFNSVSDNMVTSIKLSEVTYFGTFFAKHGFTEENMTSVKGEVVQGEDGFAEFVPDDKALFETVLDLFYIKE